MGTGEHNTAGYPCDGLASHPGGEEILLVISCYRNWDKTQPDGPQLACIQTLIRPVGIKVSIVHI